MPLTLEQLQTPLTRDQALDVILAELEALGFSVTSWQPGSVQRTLLTGVAEVYRRISEMVEFLARMAFNDTSAGSALTRFSDSHYDNQRITNVATQGYVTLTGGPIGPPYAVVAGSVEVQEPITGQRYVNLGAGVIPVSGNVQLLFQARVPGAAGNVANNTINTLVTAFAGVTCLNPPGGLAPPTTWIETLGIDEETDADLRERNSLKWASLSIDAPPEGYEYLSLIADTDVQRVLIDDDNPRGPGTVDVHIARGDGVAVAGDVANVQALINQRRGVTADVLVLAAVAQVQALTATIHVTTALHDTAKEAEIEQAAADYINSLPIGGEVLPSGTVGYLVFSELVGSITAVEGVRRVAFTTPTADVAVTAMRVVTVGAVAFTYVDIA